jgi:protein gp37
VSLTKISWADRVWNPLLGCTRVSDGCDSCYAISTVHRWAHSPNPKVATAFGGLTEHRGGRLDWTGRVNLLPDRLEPLAVRKPQRWFVNSQADLFHERVPLSHIQQVLAVVAASPRHTFMVLTKRHARMAAVMRRRGLARAVWDIATSDYGAHPAADGWPLRNLWLGVSVEDQRWAGIRIPALLDTPAAVRWISAEPLLGGIDLRPYLAAATGTEQQPGLGRVAGHQPRLDWIVVGGESGPHARPMNPAWARAVRDQALSTGTPFWFKQWGAWAPNGRHASTLSPRNTRELLSGPPLDPHGNREVLEHLGTTRAGDLLDGRTWQQLPVLGERSPAR